MLAIVRNRSAGIARNSHGQKLLCSYVFGATNESLQAQTIGQALNAASDGQPDHKAFTFSFSNIGKEIRSIGQFRADVDRLAAGLLSVGLEPGDRIGVWGPNSRQWLTTQFAAAKAGLVLVPINPAYRIGELQYCATRVGLRALVAASKFKTSDYHAMLLDMCPELATSRKGGLASKSAPSLSHVVSMDDTQRSSGVFSFEEVCQTGENLDALDRLAHIERKIQPDDIVGVLFTSGTTGEPKGAALTHHGVLNNARFAGINAGFHLSRQRICLPVPLFHCFGMVMGNLQMLLHGASLVYPAPSFDPVDTLDAIETERCTAVYCTPTMLIDVLNQPNLLSRDHSCLTGGIVGGAHCPPDLIQRAIKELGMSLLTVGYGSTETSPVIFHCSWDDSLEKRTTSVGRAAPHVEVKIVDSEGRLVPRGQLGEICTRGYHVMRGYYGQPEATAKTIGPDRWYRTGDIGFIDTEGYGYVKGRIKDMVIRGGENIYPAEIENCLHCHPSVAEAYVVGVPDPRMGEELCAVVRLKPRTNQQAATVSAEDLRAHVNSALAHFKVPRYILFREREMPMTASGKVQKFKLRDEVIEELGLRSTETSN